MNFVLAAGGTGGHMIPAHALAAELKGRGHGVLLITDERGARFPGLFEGVPVSILPAGRLGGGPIQLIKALAAVVKGRREAKELYRDFDPKVVVGFGGYPAFPSLLDLDKRMSRDKIVDVILHGSGRMPGSPNLTTLQLNALISYLRTGDAGEGSASTAINDSNAGNASTAVTSRHLEELVGARRALLGLRVFRLGAVLEPQRHRVLHVRRQPPRLLVDAALHESE